MPILNTHEQRYLEVFYPGKWVARSVLREGMSFERCPLLFLRIGLKFIHYGVGYEFGDALVEDAGDDVFGAEFGVADAAGDGFGGRHFHAFGDGVGAAVEGTAEDAREAEDVVDLVGVVAAAGGHDGDVGGGLFGHDFGDGVRHGEDDWVFGHALQVLDVEHTGSGEADEDVCTFDHFGEGAADALGVGDLGKGFL